MSGSFLYDRVFTFKFLSYTVRAVVASPLIAELSRSSGSLFLVLFCCCFEALCFVDQRPG